LEKTAFELIKFAVEIAIVDLDSCPMLEARNMRLPTPSMKLFINAIPLDYLKKVDHSSMLPWLKLKTNPSSLLITHPAVLMQAISENAYFILYVGPLSIKKYSNFKEVEQAMLKFDHLAFGAIDAFNFDTDLLNMPSLLENGYGIRVYSHKSSG